MAKKKAEAPKAQATRSCMKLDRIADRARRIKAKGLVASPKSCDGPSCEV